MTKNSFGINIIHRTFSYAILNRSFGTLLTIKKIKNEIQNPDQYGYYGDFGGAFVPEMLYPNVKELEDNYLDIINSDDFRKEYNALLKDYVGRATPLYFAKNLSNKYQTNIYLKRGSEPYRCS
jgi:hypothetical protein